MDQILINTTILSKFNQNFVFLKIQILNFMDMKAQRDGINLLSKFNIAKKKIIQTVRLQMK